MPKVSIIIPVYNVEKYLRQCLDSVVNQTLKDIEIICIDDGSPDNCGQIIDEYVSNDNRVVAIHKENGGYASAINKGLEVAKSEYIAIVESDDFCELNMCEVLYNKINETDADYVISEFYNYSEEKRERRDYFEEIKKNNYDGCFNLELCPSLLMISAYPWKSLYRKNYLDINNIRMIQDGKGAYEDQPWNLTVLSKAKKIIINDTPTYNYRVDATNSSTNNGSKKMINYIGRRRQALEILKESGCYKGDIKEYFWWSCILGLLFFFRQIKPEYKEEYYKEMKKFLQENMSDIECMYFSLKIKSRYKRICTLSYSSYRLTYWFYEISRILSEKFCKIV